MQVLSYSEKLLIGTKKRALRKGIPFDLDMNWVKENWTGKCSLTNLEFEFSKGNVTRVPTIDRINPCKTVGYIKSNCRLILFCINSFKFTGTDENIYEVADALLNNVNSEKLKFYAPAYTLLSSPPCPMPLPIDIFECWDDSATGRRIKTRALK